MNVINVFDAAMYADVKTFMGYYSKEKLNLLGEYSDVNLLCGALIVEKNENNKNKIKIIKFLIKEGIDINFSSHKSKFNALHYLFYNILRADVSFYMEVVKLLVENGIDVNHKDKYGAIPLSPAIAVNKLDTQDMKPVYEYLLKNGCEYNSKDNYGNSCMDYAKRFGWRNDFIDIVKEYENENR